MRYTEWFSLLFPREYSDFASLGQPFNDLGFIVCIMDASLSELSRIAILLPVVMPVSPAVRPKTEHIHLKESEVGKCVIYRRVFLPDKSFWKYI